MIAKRKPRLLFYCQHVLGMGHFTRSIELVKGLTAFDVFFLNGGDVIDGFELPPSVEFIHLPPIKADSEFRDIEAADASLNLQAIKEARKARILEACETIRPDIAVIELFPFGRRKFAFELLPMLDMLRRSGTFVVCSLRDILVSKRDQSRFEEQALALANEYIDMLLVHSDPRFQTLEETFGGVASLRCALRYTGFVVQKPAARLRVAKEKATIVVSIGGGRVGGELLEAAIRASAALEARRPHRMLAFAGPYCTQEQWDCARRLAAMSPSVHLERYSPHFLDVMAGADLSVSMAGYNTCMNILATGVPALVYPFTGNNNEEQTMRALKLQTLGAMSMLRADDLTPASLADRILQSVESPAPQSVCLDLDGVATTAELLLSCVDEVAA